MIDKEKTLYNLIGKIAFTEVEYQNLLDKYCDLERKYKALRENKQKHLDNLINEMALSKTEHQILINEHVKLQNDYSRTNKALDKFIEENQILRKKIEKIEGRSFLKGLIGR